MTDSARRKRPVRRIRPPRNQAFREMFRYANGQWIPDDGQPDLAFYGRSEDFFPYAFGWTRSEGEKRWGEDAHPNERAYDSAMRTCCDRYGAANGRRVRAVRS